MLGKNSLGFTLVEILIAIAIVAIIMAVALPNMKRFAPGYPRKEFINNLNAVTQFAWNNALTTRKVQQVHFDFDKRIVSIKAATGAVKDGENEFLPLKASYVKARLMIPKTIEVKNFVIEGTDQFGLSAKRSEAWFYIVPDGMAQTVTINFNDNKDTLPSGKPRPVGLVLNPFNARFKLYDSFQK